MHLHVKRLRLTMFGAIGLSVALCSLGGPRSAHAYDLTPLQIAEKCDNYGLRLNGKGQDPGLNKQYANLTDELNRLDYNIYKGYPQTLAFWQQKVIELDAAAIGAPSATQVAMQIALSFAKSQVTAFQTALRDARQAKNEVTQLRTAVDNERKYLNTSLVAFRCPASYDLSGDWKVTWEWTVTEVEFVGTLSGGGNSWSFEGTVSGGGNAIWHPKKGEGSCKCTLVGAIGKPKGGQISCTANFPGQSAWTVQAGGTIEGIFDGKKHQIWFKGQGNGIGGEGKPAVVNDLELQPANG